jgi:hypothetical protein
MKQVGYAACIWRRELHTGFCWRNLIERDHFEDLGLDRGIILNRGEKEIEWDMVDWIDLAQHRENWRPRENITIILRVL